MMYNKPQSHTTWGVIILVLTDSSLCGPGSARCTSGQARVAISIIAG